MYFENITIGLNFSVKFTTINLTASFENIIKKGLMIMKKRLISIIMLVLMLVPNLSAVAQVDTSNVAQVVNYSEWAADELNLGSYYGIIPTSWADLDFTKPIKGSQLRALIAQLKHKILASNKAAQEYIPSLDFDKITVEEVLKALYDVISSYEYSADIGLDKGYNPVEYMTQYGVYNELGAELKLQDICSVEQACVFATRIVTYLYEALDASSKGFLWEVNNKGNKVYLLGSIHVANHDIYPFSQEMLKAYESSDALIVEVNLFDYVGLMNFTALTMYSDGTSLKDHISEETYKETVELAGLFGLREEDIAMFKPWYINTLFSNLSSTETGDFDEASIAAQLGIDMNFMVNAMMQGKPILEIEGYEFQGKVMDSFSRELQEYLLKDSINSLKNMIYNPGSQVSTGYDYINVLLNLWKIGDAETFGQVYGVDYEAIKNSTISQVEKELIEEYIDKLIRKRDIGMADYIDNLLNAEGNNTYFVVVGSGHYISDYSVIDILIEKGYTVNQIK